MPAVVGGPGADLNFQAAPIQVLAKNATPEAAIQSIQENQAQLQRVNNLTSGGGRRGRSRKMNKSNHIRTYKGRKYVNSQYGGSNGSNGSIIIPQAPGQNSCIEGPSCAGVQNANLTSILNQAKSSSANDGYVSTGGGGGKNITRYRHGRSRRHHKTGRKTLLGELFSELFNNTSMKDSSRSKNRRKYKTKYRFRKSRK